ncbi:MAG: hypothetical protein R3228_03185 [Halioglobus sp.]|nr:hypothetical protein [Halioglobus sp.]
MTPSIEAFAGAPEPAAIVTGSPDRSPCQVAVRRDVQRQPSVAH